MIWELTVLAGRLGFGSDGRPSLACDFHVTALLVQVDLILGHFQLSFLILSLIFLRVTLFLKEVYPPTVFSSNQGISFLGFTPSRF